jgi:hypothetical protein
MSGDQLELRSIEAHPVFISLVAEYSGISLSEAILVAPRQRSNAPRPQRREMAETSTTLEWLRSLQESASSDGLAVHPQLSANRRS